MLASTVIGRGFGEVACSRGHEDSFRLVKRSAGAGKKTIEGKASRRGARVWPVLKNGKKKGGGERDVLLGGAGGRHSLKENLFLQNIYVRWRTRKR